jgi:E3 ubiquitin-protein ligase UBR7
MNWASPSLSHHCTEATKSVVALCDTELESPHLLAIGGDLGNVDVINLASRTSVASFTEMHQSNVLGLGFWRRGHLLSFDQSDFLMIDIESSNRTEILDSRNPISAFSFSGETVIAASTEQVFLWDGRVNPISLMNAQQVSEVCLLPDEVTLFAVQFGSVVVTDIRRPDGFHGLGIPEVFEKLACNGRYLAGVTDSLHLFVSEYPVQQESLIELCQYESPFRNRPTFVGDFVAIGDSLGTIFIFDPATMESDIMQLPGSEVVVSLAATTAEIAAASEDDIFVFSHFPMEDNLIRPAEDDDFFGEVEEEEEKEPWLAQPDGIRVESGECTYERYGYCEQQVFVCMTCVTDRSRPFGICQQCAQVCHVDHNVRPIGTRRRFRCDCGNDRSHCRCRAMCDPKASENIHNRYSHNFFERWCVCDGPDRRDEPMVQCIVCSDWFHHRCIGMFSEMRCPLMEGLPELDEWVFVCKECCETRLTFLSEYPDGEVPAKLAELVAELRVENQVEFGGLPDKPGVGFRIAGGRWVAKAQFWKFAGISEFDAEFAVLETAEEDRNLGPAHGQAEYAQVFRELYRGLFETMERSGRTVVQSSDVRAALRAGLSRLIQRPRDPSLPDT